MWRRLIPLVSLLASVWVLMLLATYGISILMVNPSGIANIWSRVALGFYHVVVGGVIFLFWLWIWKKLTEYYFKFFSK